MVARLRAWSPRVTLGVAASGSFPWNPDNNARTPRRLCRHAPHEDRARFLPVVLSPRFCPRTPTSTAAGAAPHGVPATRVGRPGGAPVTRAGRPLRGAERASWLADNGQAAGQSADGGERGSGQSAARNSRDARWSPREDPNDARGSLAARGQLVRPSRDGEARAGRSSGQASRINSVKLRSLAKAAASLLHRFVRVANCSSCFRKPSGGLARKNSMQTAPLGPEEGSWGGGRRRNASCASETLGGAPCGATKRVKGVPKRGGGAMRAAPLGP
eukprot:285068-Pyramimonas_sp.AAC.1